MVEKFSGFILYKIEKCKESGRDSFFDGGGDYFFSVLARNLWRPWPAFLLPWWPDHELTSTAKSLLAQFQDSWLCTECRSNLYDHLSLTWITANTGQRNLLIDFLTSGRNLISIHPITYFGKGSHYKYTTILTIFTKQFQTNFVFCVIQMCD